MTAKDDVNTLHFGCQPAIHNRADMSNCNDDLGPFFFQSLNHFSGNCSLVVSNFHLTGNGNHGKILCHHREKTNLDPLVTPEYIRLTAFSHDRFPHHQIRAEGSEVNGIKRLGNDCIFF